MRIANTVSDSIVDGPGLRLTIFTQGCTHGCPGCHNPDTHDPAGGRWVEVEALIPLMDGNPLLRGLTLSGGDPFFQAADCAQLAQAARQRGLNVWTYTGYTWQAIRKAGNPNWDALLQATDVLVDGPFRLEQKSYEALFRGSSNQRLIDVAASLAAGQVVLWQQPGNLDHFVRPES